MPPRTFSKNEQQNLRSLARTKLGLHKNASIKQILKSLNSHAVNENNFYQQMELRRLADVKDKMKKEAEEKAKAWAASLIQKAEYKQKKKDSGKLIKKYLQKKLTAKRYKLEAVERMHKVYEKFIIPSYDNWIQKKMKKLQKKLKSTAAFLEMNKKDVFSYAKQIDNYMYPTITKKLKEFKSLRAYVDVQFKCFNSQKGESFTFKKYLGVLNFTSHREFNQYFKKGVEDAFDHLLGKDYIICYGFGSVDVSTLKYNPLSGSSYTELPDFIKNTKSIINIQNKDEKCFLWCMIASRHLPERDCERVAKYNKPEFISEWKINDLPMPISKIHYFEKQNNVNVNIYSLDNDNKTRIPLHISKQNSDEVVNLFYWNNHYSLIKNFSRFSGGRYEFTCPNCLASYAKPDAYKNHIGICKQLNENGSFVKMPEEKTMKKEDGTEYKIKPQTYFKDYKKQKKLPVVMYADFESSLVEADSRIRKGVIAKHTANSYRLHIESEVELGIPLDYCYTGEDVDTHFINLLINQLEGHIQETLNNCCDEHKNINEEKFTPQDLNNFNNAKVCIFCNKDLKTDRVRDHCHFTGKYEGAAHSQCNIKSHQMFKGKINIPIFFHNANYDIRCFISAFQKMKGDEVLVDKISGIPCNMEIYKSLNINTFSINCSYAHLSSSLDTLIKNLPDNKKDLLRTIADTDEKFELIKKKGFYPYEMITNIEKLDMPIQDLKQEHFDSRLNLSKLSNDDWEHVQKVITVFGFTSFRQYHDLYLKIDVFGLRDVFEYHRELSMRTYGLDPAHFIGLPQLTWAAGLKFTGIKLDDIMDMDMFMMFEKMKRGGISVISHKYAKANNHYLPDYDDTKEKSFLIQLDCNNLYGKSMCEKLPVNGFKWVTHIDENYIKKYDIDRNDKGYALEVDLEYPEHLHDEHNDYPLAPEHKVINGFCKLAPNFENKTHYVVHIENLKYYLSKGLVLKNIHRVVEFNHSLWLKPYIEFNGKMRQQATNDFEKDFYKLMNNAFYGKTMENVRDRVNIQFCMTKERFTKHTSSHLFAGQINVINEDGLALVKTHKKTVILDKPIYIGACVLDLSKLLMFKFHYDTMKVKYPESLMMKTDTDSLLYYIKTDDLYQDFKNDAGIQKQLEFSNYPKNHFLYNCDRKKIPGLFQDECVDGKMMVISKYVGLRAKSYVNQLYEVEETDYNISYDNDMKISPSNILYPISFKDKKKSKGVPSKHIKNRVTFDDYKDCLDTGKDIKLGDETSKPQHQEQIYTFISKQMTTYSILQSKIALSSRDDKRIPIDDIYTLAIGHYKTLR